MTCDNHRILSYMYDTNEIIIMLFPLASFCFAVGISIGKSV